MLINGSVDGFLLGSFVKNKYWAIENPPPFYEVLHMIGKLVCGAHLELRV